jgi:F0F1-type ATP synthase assembly protein I
MLTSSDFLILIVGLLFGSLAGIAIAERKMAKISDSAECFHYKRKVYKVFEVKK